MDSIKYDVFKLKSQEVKFNAFFEYLKSFSEAGLETLQKLENDFQKEMKKKAKEVEKLTLMKSILSSYEIFILEIKDSCDFVEIPEFGYCIGKAFVQLLKIIKWFLRSWMQNSRKYEKVAQRLQISQTKQIEEKQPQMNVCEFCEEVMKVTPYSRDGRNKRKGVAINELNHELRSAKMNHYHEMSQIMEFKQNVLQRYTMKDISSKRYISDPGDIDILNRKHMAMKLQTSANGSMLQQILNEFNLKTESISRFMANTQAMCVEDFKISSQMDYEVFEGEMKVRIAQKFDEAREKLKTLVAGKIAESEKAKRGKMVDREIQAEVRDFAEKDRLQQKVKIITAEYHKLKNELESERNLNEGLRKMLEEKSVEFEEEFLNYRRNAIVVGEKSSKNNKSLKSYKELYEDKDQPKQESIDRNSKLLVPQEFEYFQSRDKFVKRHVRGIQGHIKKHSIKITFENDSEEQKPKVAFDELSLNQFLVTRVQAQTQTEPITEPPIHTGKKFFIINREEIDNERSKMKKIEFEKKEAKRLIQTLQTPTPLAYSHVSSKLSTKCENIYIKKEKPKARTFVDQYMRNLSKDNSTIEQPSIEDTRCYKLKEEPGFFKVYRLQFTKQDVLKLYRNYKNLHNYECQLYRGSSVPKKSGQKRAQTFGLSKETVSLEESFRNESQENKSTENKLVTAIYKQLINLKKRQKNLHNEIKVILRSPTEVGQNLDVVYLQNHKEALEKDIELSELKKMVSLIFKYHADCIGCAKEVICNHLVSFLAKIGISIAEIESSP